MRIRNSDLDPGTPSDPLKKEVGVFCLTGWRLLSELENASWVFEEEKKFFSHFWFFWMRMRVQQK
jgi:hypothetical protein